MSKTILKTLAVAAFAMIAGYNVYQAHSETEGMSELALANVEALAAGEGVGITCSAKCNGGIGKCWVRSGGAFCIFSSIYDSCTGLTCVRSDGSQYNSLQFL